MADRPMTPHDELIRQLNEAFGATAQAPDSEAKSESAKPSRIKRMIPYAKALAVTVAKMVAVLMISGTALWMATITLATLGFMQAWQWWQCIALIGAWAVVSSTTPIPIHIRSRG